MSATPHRGGDDDLPQVYWLGREVVYDNAFLVITPPPGRKWINHKGVQDHPVSEQILQYYKWVSSARSVTSNIRSIDTPLHQTPS